MLEWRLKSVRIEALIDVLICGAIHLLIVKRILLSVLQLLLLLTLLLLLLYHRHERGTVDVIHTNRVLMEKLNEQRLIVCQIGECCARKMARIVGRWLHLRGNWKLAHTFQARMCT